MSIDRNSATWKTVMRWAAERRGLAIDGLISGSNTAADERNRGEIRTLDDLMALVEDAPPASNEPNDY